MGRALQKIELEIPTKLLELFPTEQTPLPHGGYVVSPAPIDSKTLVKLAKERHICHRAIVFKKLRRFVKDGLVTQPSKGLYELTPLPFSWEFAKRTKTFQTRSLKRRLQNEDVLREQFQIAFELTLKAYVDMLNKLINLQDGDQARNLVASFLNEREIIGPLAWLAQAIYANRKKVPMEYARKMVMKISAGSGRLGQL